MIKKNGPSAALGACQALRVHPATIGSSGSRSGGWKPANATFSESTKRSSRSRGRIATVADSTRTRPFKELAQTRPLPGQRPELGPFMGRRRRPGTRRIRGAGPHLRALRPASLRQPVHRREPGEHRGATRRRRATTPRCRRRSSTAQQSEPDRASVVWILADPPGRGASTVTESGRGWRDTELPRRRAPPGTAGLTG